jgi:beta-lactamase class A
MPKALTRRALLGAFASIPVLSAPVLLSASHAVASPGARPGEIALAELESKNGGRLGVAALDLESGRRIGHRADERFAMCSTFKYLAAACVLARVDRGEERLDRAVNVAQSDLVTYSPVVEKHVGSTITVAELCDAAITLSDNAAGNLLLASFGGPAGLTDFLRSIADGVSRLDRWEPDLNEARKGDLRDTTTPGAMLDTMNKLVLGDVLTPGSRRQLEDWLVANTTGGKRIRAGVPEGWRVGDKTGTGSNGATNDVAVLWPPGRKPILLTVYYAEADIAQGKRDNVVAEAARLVSAAF